MENSLYHLLRHNSNPDCLVRIFEQLNGIELQTICDSDTRNDPFFSELVYFDVIKKKLVCASSWRDERCWTVTKTMHTFGPMITQLKIKTAPMFLEMFVRLLVDNSDPDTLRELQVELHPRNVRGNPLHINQQLMNDAIPYFRRLQVLKIDDRTKWDGLERFVATIINHSPNLRLLSLRGIVVNELHELLLADKYNLTELELFHLVLGRSAEQRQVIRRFLQKFACLELLITDRTFHRHRESIVMGRIAFVWLWGEITVGTNFSVEINNITKVSVIALSPTGSDITSTLKILATKKRSIKTLRFELGGMQWAFFGGNMGSLEPMNFSSEFACLENLIIHGPLIRINVNALQLFTESVIRHIRGLQTIRFSSLRSCSMIINQLYTIPSTLDFSHTELEETEVMLITQAIHNSVGRITTHYPINTIVRSHQVEHFRKYGNKNITITIV